MFRTLKYKITAVGCCNEEEIYFPPSKVSASANGSLETTGTNEGIVYRQLSRTD